MREASRRGNRLRHLEALRPQDRAQLHTLVKRLWGIDVVSAVGDGDSAAPLDYLAHTFFEPGQKSLEARDCVVWANRGGGKTMLGAVATLLDLIFKPGIEVRVLGGSLEQATKMHEHLVRLLEQDTMRGVLAARTTARRVVLSNGSRVEVLAGSQRSVRGVRVHKVRCDEVEELDPAVWEAAQMATRSGRCGPVWVRGAVEALSTMHRPGGLMARLVGGEGELEDSENTVKIPVKSVCPEGVSVEPKVFRWNAMDVAARCPAALACEGCVLWDDCGGRAKEGVGFVPVTDLMQQRRRTSSVAWSAEMMCRRPGVQHGVYASFDFDEHVCAEARGFGDPKTAGWVGGMDFGLRCPTVMLWAAVSGMGAEASVHVVAEYDGKGRTLEQNLSAIEKVRKTLELPAPNGLDWLAIDPAGNARNAHSGQSDSAVLRRHGYRVRSCASRIDHGIEIIRRRLDQGTLTIHPRCGRLIGAMQGYHFDAQRLELQTPVKDGPDHWCDALRYMLVQMERATPTVAGRYA